MPSDDLDRLVREPERFLERAGGGEHPRPRHPPEPLRGEIVLRRERPTLLRERVGLLVASDVTERQCDQTADRRVEARFTHRLVGRVHLPEDRLRLVQPSLQPKRLSGRLVRGDRPHSACPALRTAQPIGRSPACASSKRPAIPSRPARTRRSWPSPLGLSPCRSVGPVERGERLVERERAEVRADAELPGDLLPRPPGHRRRAVHQLVEDLHGLARLPLEEGHEREHEHRPVAKLHVAESPRLVEDRRRLLRARSPSSDPGRSMPGP